MDLNKLTIGDRVVVISALLFLIFMFFPWYGFSVEGFADPSRNGFDYPLWGWIPLLLAIGMVAQIAVARFSTTSMPAVGSLTWGQIHLIAGAVAAALVLLKLAIGDDVSVFVEDFDLDRKFGIFLAFLATLGLVAGGLLKMRDPADAAAAGGPAGPPPTPPPGPPSA